MNIYLSARTGFLLGRFDLSGDPLRAQLVGDGFTFDGTDAYASDLTGKVGAPIDVTVIDVSGGEVHVEPITFPGVPDGANVIGVVTYRWTGDLATSDLIAHADRRADSVPLGFAGTGGDVTLDFVDYLLKI